MAEKFDAVVVGGGFYGAAIAIFLAKFKGLQRVALVERESALLQRASYSNQARIHNGYHYPRSFTTAYRSRVNFPQFVEGFPDAVVSDFTKLYAIAKRNSKVTAKQFVRFCREIGASLDVASPEMKKFFQGGLIEEVYIVEELAFNTNVLAEWARQELRSVGVAVILDTQVSALHACEGFIKCETFCTSLPDKTCEIDARYVFNCTYSGLNQIHGDYPKTQTRLKHEITEMALLQMPPQFEGLGVTVMDGPFFSVMPFPARGLHTLSHVRYTPHSSWADAAHVNPYERLDTYDKATRVNWMLRDASRYMPGLCDAVPMDSLFEVKTILTKNEGDDGRPILYEKHEALPGCYSILGGKIDNIYDVLEKLGNEDIK